MAYRLLHLARHGQAGVDGALTEVGRRQATLLGRRLAGTPIAAVHHGPLPRAAQTATAIANHLPGVPVRACELLDDYYPPVPDPTALPEPYARFLDGVPPAAYAEGAGLAAEALDRYTAPTDTDTRELLVTHNFQIGWFVRHALDAPVWRWLGLNQCNGALTTILYRPDRPPALLAFNDMSHLDEPLRWTDVPPHLRP
jgi:probable phosphoglycerate mutase